jgi:hypothetical protein
VIHVLGVALALLVNAHRWNGPDRPFVVQPGGRVAPLLRSANLARVRRSPDGRFIAGLAPDGSLRVLRPDGSWSYVAAPGGTCRWSGWRSAGHGS